MESFPKLERYRIVRKIGEGGLGVVYAAQDTERDDQLVALKTFKRGGSDDLFRIKQEFRSLSNISHPNLVGLNELVVAHDKAYFSMELVEGIEFLDYLREGLPAVDDAADLAETLPRAHRRLACDEERLRDTLPQLALGAHALHEAGKVHRDLKPSNALVTPEGIVKILDFGLTVDVAARESETLGGAVGTLLYMSPEQAAGLKALSPATDWYSFGVILYEALTGQVPFTGNLYQLVKLKNERTATPPRQLVSVVPEDLDELCVRLLARDPNDRPSGTEVLERLGAKRPRRMATGSRESSLSSRGRDSNLFVGRDRELALAREVWEQVAAQSEPQLLLLKSASGMGKTSLVREFVRQLGQQHPDLVVLEGKCFEREDVPYSAMDDLIDGLSRYWRKLRGGDAQRLLPRQPEFLPVIFPVLKRVHAVAQRVTPLPSEDMQSLRTHAYAALREVFARLASEHPLVLFLDDMQWADPDSVALLAELLRPPAAPPLMLVLCSRDYEPERMKVLEGFLENLDSNSHVLELEPFDDETCLTLAQRVQGKLSDERLAAVVRDARGNPYFATELARAIASGHEAATLDEMILARTAELGPGALEIARFLAVAGEPLTRALLATACDRPLADLARDVRLLRAQNLVRAAGGRADDDVALFHDRIREAVVAPLSDEERRGRSSKLATALEASGSGSPARLARYYRGAGEHSIAAVHARAAAEEARASLDFDRAGELWRLALELHDWPDADRLQMHSSVGQALAAAGRPREAAAAYAAAAALAPEGEAFELARQRTELLLTGGFLEDGLGAAAELARQAGLHWPRSNASVVTRIVGHETLAALGAVRWSQGKEDPTRRVRHDVAFSLGLGLAMVDSMRGFLFSHRARRLSRQGAEPSRYLRSSAMNLGGDAAMGRKKRVARSLVHMQQLVARHPSSEAHMYVDVASAWMSFFFKGNWKDAVFYLDRALVRYAELGRGNAAEADIVRVLRCFALRWGGHYNDLRDMVYPQATRAARSGNRFLEVSLSAAFLPLLYLVDDRPDRARRALATAENKWFDLSETGILLQHYYLFLSTCDIAAYTGDPTIVQQAKSLYQALRKSTLYRLQNIRVESTIFYGRLLLASPDATASELAAVRKLARRDRKSPYPLGGLLEPLLLAGVAKREGDDDTALSLLSTAAAQLEDAGTMMYAYAAKYRLGQMMGGDEGARLVDEASEGMREQGADRPSRIATLLAPGWD